MPRQGTQFSLADVLYLHRPAEAGCAQFVRYSCVAVDECAPCSQPWFGSCTRLLQALCTILEQVPLILPGKKLKQLVGSNVKPMQDAVRQLQQTSPAKKVS